ncbi:MAG: glycosyltransferase [Thiotrichales bacterium]
MPHTVLAVRRSLNPASRVPRVMTIIDTMNIGGAGKVVLQFLQHADRSRFEHTLCNFRYRNPHSTEFNDTAQRLGFAPHLFSQSSNIDPSPIVQALRLARAGQFGIVETHGYKANLIGYCLHRLFGLRWVVYLHGWTDESRRMRYYRRLDHFCIRRADRVIGVSPALIETAATLRDDRSGTHLLLNGIDPANIPGSSATRATVRERLGVAGDDFLIGCFGRLSPEKGQSILLHAIKTLANRRIKVLFLGDGPDAKLLRELTERENLVDNVFFVSHSATTREYYDAIDLLAIPSLSEGLPFVLLESMALFKPVIASAVGAIPEVIGDGVNGWLFPPGDIAVLANRLHHVIDHPETVPALTRAANETVSARFSARHHAEQLVSIYEALADA